MPRPDLGVAYFLIRSLRVNSAQAPLESFVCSRSRKCRTLIGHDIEVKLQAKVIGEDLRPNVGAVVDRSDGFKVQACTHKHPTIHSGHHAISISSFSKTVTSLQMKPVWNQTKQTTSFLGGMLS